MYVLREITAVDWRYMSNGTKRQRLGSPSIYFNWHAGVYTVNEVSQVCQDRQRAREGVCVWVGGWVGAESICVLDLFYFNFRCA